MRFISLFLAAFLVAGLALAGDIKIATVDLQKLFKDYPGTQKAEDQLKEIEKKKIKELTPMEDELKDLQNELQNNSSVLSKLSIQRSTERRDCLVVVFINIEQAEHTHHAQRFLREAGKVHQLDASSSLLRRGKKSHQYTDAAGVDHRHFRQVDDEARVPLRQ